MCGKPTINGEPDYSWDGQKRSVRPIDPPEMAEGDILMFDEPGRCGGTDAHCHHYRLVKFYSQRILIVKHGGGTERHLLSAWNKAMDTLVDSLDSNARFWMFNAIHHTIKGQVSKAEANVRAQWASAFIDKRIKKQKRKGNVRVWIDDKSPVSA